MHSKENGKKKGLSSRALCKTMNSNAYQLEKNIETIVGYRSHKKIVVACVGCKAFNKV